jgi:hypothetical protein
VDIRLDKGVVSKGEEISITVIAEGDGLSYLWLTTYGHVDASDWTPRSTVTYTAPDFTTVDTVSVSVRDANGDIVSDEIDIQIVGD